MNKFLERHKLPNLTLAENENLNRTIRREEIEPIMKNLPTKQSPEPDGLPGEFYQSSKEKLTPLLPKFSKNRKGRN